MAKLPGGLPVWWGRWLLVRARPRGHAKARALRGAGLPSPVTAERHVELHTLVGEAARLAGAPMPARITLGGTGRIGSLSDLGASGVFGAGRDVLSVGLPLVWGLSADQLRAVVAHELALPVTDRPQLVRALLAVRRVAAERVAAFEDRADVDEDRGVDGAGPVSVASGRTGQDASVGDRRDRAVLAATDALATAVEGVRDAVAVEAIGAGLSAVEDAALAVFRAAAIDEGFRGFARTSGQYVVDGQALRVRDLHAGWRLRLEHWGAPGTGWHPRTPHERIPHAHPGLAAELRALAEEHDGYRTDLAKETVTLDPLTDAEEQQLAAEALMADDIDRSAADGSSGGWTRYAELPVSVYGVDVERTAREYVRAVQDVLGRPPDGPDELAGTLLRRPVEVQRARHRARFGDVAVDAATTPPWMGAALLAVVVEYTLIKKGWRREHPLLARRMTAADSGILDLNTLYGRPEELCRFLTAPPDTAA